MSFVGNNVLMSKAFVVSIGARRGKETETYPLLISGESAEEVRAAAEILCKESWPLYEGWTGHNAVIVTLSAENAGELFFDIREGLVDLVYEPTDDLQFCC
jgi:hypothetical protein